MGPCTSDRNSTVLFLKACGVWFGRLLAACLNGALRALLIVRLVGAQLAHVLRVCLLSGAIFGITSVFVKALRPLPSSTLCQIGLCWLLLSLPFACGFFHYVMHEPWEKLLADDNIFRGRLLSVVWLTTLFSSLLCGKLTRGKRDTIW